MRINPKYVVALNNLGAGLLLKGNREGAIKAVREAIVLDPKCVDAYFNLGVILKGNRDLSGAVAAFKKVVALDPKYSQSLPGSGLRPPQKERERRPGRCDRSVQASRRARPQIRKHPHRSGSRAVRQGG